MTILDAALVFAVVAGLLTLVPGPDTDLVLRSTLTGARPYAYATAAGVATGAMTRGIAAALGVSALLDASELAYRFLTTAGAVYMLWLGASRSWKSFRGGAGPADGVAVPPSEAESPWQGWMIGDGTNLLNPKVGIFYVATIPQFLPAGTSPLLMGAVLAGMHAALAPAWFSVLILGGGLARRRLADPRALALIDRVTGLVLVLFGNKLLPDAMPSGPSASSASAVRGAHGHEPECLPRRRSAAGRRSRCPRRRSAACDGRPAGVPPP